MGLAHAAGAFTATQGGGTALARVGRFDGAQWHALGAGMNDVVSALAVFDEGAGPRLFAAGVFTQADGAPANRIARWDGASWSAVGAGFDLPVLTLCVFDDGGGEALYAGGEFSLAGGAPAQHVARWNGTSWSALGNGFDGRVRALHVHDDGGGGGAALFAGGNFASSGALPLGRVARWNGSAWSALGAGVDGEVFGLGSSNAGELWAGGLFTHAGGIAAERVARWNGTSWSPAGMGMTGATAGLPFVAAFATFDEGAGPRLFAGGDCLRADGRAVNHIARWEAGAWSPVPAGGGFLGSYSSDYVLAYGAHDFGGGPELVAGGRFDASSGGSVKNVARWDGSSWRPLGAGFEGGPPQYGPEVRAFASYDAGLGAGSELYAVGRFTLSGGVLVNHVARWDGALWQPVGGGLSDDAFALAVYDDGTGPALYATGQFTSAGGVPAPKVARWNGTAWSSLPVNGPIGALNVGVSLAVWDDGSGPALIVGGAFGTQPFSTVASYRAGTWTSLGFGGDARALAVFDAGSGPELFSGGTNGIWRRGRRDGARARALRGRTVPERPAARHRALARRRIELDGGRGWTRRARDRARRRRRRDGRGADPVRRRDLHGRRRPTVALRRAPRGVRPRAVLRRRRARPSGDHGVPVRELWRPGPRLRVERERERRRALRRRPHSPRRRRVARERPAGEHRGAVPRGRRARRDGRRLRRRRALRRRDDHAPRAAADRGRHRAVPRSWRSAALRAHRDRERKRRRRVLPGVVPEHCGAVLSAGDVERHERGAHPLVSVGASPGGVRLL